MKISLIHPSRGRPEQSFANSSEWLRKAGNVDVELIVSVDVSDPTQKKYLSYYAGNCYIFDSRSVVEATNHAARRATGDILIYLSDDFKCPDNWGELIVKEFAEQNRPLLLKVNDGLQNFDAPVLTIPMMNRGLYEKLGYFWHPAYKSMHVDVDLFYTCQNIGAIKNAKHLTFEHHHPSNGKAQDDATYKASAANWNQGLEVLSRRRKQKFPI